MIKLTSRERVQFNIDIYRTSWIGGGAKVVWQWGYS